MVYHRGNAFEIQTVCIKRGKFRTWDGCHCVIRDMKRKVLHSVKDNSQYTREKEAILMMVVVKV